MLSFAKLSQNLQKKPNLGIDRTCDRGVGLKIEKETVMKASNVYVDWYMKQRKEVFINLMRVATYHIVAIACPPSGCHHRLHKF